jgi:hypothetical protein
VVSEDPPAVPRTVLGMLPFASVDETDVANVTLASLVMPLMVGDRF